MLPSTTRVRLAGGASIVGGALALVIAPLAALASERAYAMRIGEPPPPPDVLSPLLTFAEPGRVYATYGRLWVPVVLLFLAGAWAVRVAWLPTLSRRGRWGTVLLVAGLALQVPGNVGDYWFGEARLGGVVWGASFLATTVGILVASAGGVLVGLELAGDRGVRRAAGVALLLLPVGFLLVPVVPNMPAAAMLVAGVTWLVTGAALVWQPAVRTD